MEAAAAGTSETHGNGVKYLCETFFSRSGSVCERDGTDLRVSGWMDGWVWVLLVWGERATRTMVNG